MKRFFALLLALALLGASGCDEPDNDDGTVITGIVLPRDVVLNLNCPDVGIFPETCVLTDPENPFATAVINEFDENNPDADTKFQLAETIPAGPSGAKARFYLWATALARRPSGENQFYTARALQELFDVNEDSIVQQQALLAYRSVLDNFFGAESFFPAGDVFLPFPLNETVAEDLIAILGNVPALALLADWGYSYVNGVVGMIEI